MKTAVIYARYSSERQTEQSIEGQLRVCNEYAERAERNDLIIIDTYIDRAMTGTNDNRAAFQKMMKDSNKKAWDVVFVYKLDRFSRDKYETAIHRRTLKTMALNWYPLWRIFRILPKALFLKACSKDLAVITIRSISVCVVVEDFHLVFLE